jgi:hypothetical protein
MPSRIVSPSDPTDNQSIHSSALPIRSIRADGGTQSRVMIDWSTVADYAEALAAGGELPPVIVFFDGADYWLADGFHRYYACMQLGLAELDADVRSGTVRDARLYSAGANTSHGLRRTNEDKRNAVLMLLNDAEWARWSDREIARRCGVGADLVGDLRKSLSFNDSEPRTYTDRYGNVTTMNTANIGRPSESADDGPGMFDEPEPAYADDPPPRSYPLTASNHISASDGYDGDEWYTPAEYVEAARRVMGGIDLDPASCEIANQIVGAETFYTKEHDGLQFNWSGRVFLNPPYSYPKVEQFTSRLIEQVAAGYTDEAILLVNNSTDTDWFQALLSRFPACFTDGRVRFYRDTGEYFGTRQGQAFFYAGPNRDRFIAEFAGFGTIVEVAA